MTADEGQSKARHWISKRKPLKLPNLPKSRSKSPGPEHRDRSAVKPAKSSTPGTPGHNSPCLVPEPQARHPGSLPYGVKSRRGGRSERAYRLVDGPRLQQRSVRREATTPARRKISVVTQNPMVVGGLDEQSSSRAAAAFSLSLARWIARPGKGTRHARGGQAREARGRWSCCQPRHVRVLLDRES